MGSEVADSGKAAGRVPAAGGREGAARGARAVGSEEAGTEVEAARVVETVVAKEAAHR